MEIVHGHRALGRPLRNPAIAIGNFDGVHRGHQKLFAEIRKIADAQSGEAVVLTFDPHPAKLLAPTFAPPLICTPARKVARIAECGVDVCVVEPFDRAFAARSPSQFVEQVVVGALGARAVCVGYDFTFGKGRQGSVALLGALGEQHHFSVHVVDPVTVNGMVCSSTKVREFILEGRVEGAALLLGRDPEVEGEVVTGQGRGRSIGVPTANLRPQTELLPKPGVYAGWALLSSGERFDAAINIGTNPTFAAVGATSPLTVEAHLIDFGGAALYGQRVVLGFRKRLRGEERFPSVEALVEQIHRDVEASRSPQRRGA